MTEIFFSISRYGHGATLFILVLLSVFSLAFIIERFLYLKKLKSQSQKVAYRMAEILKTGDFTELEKMASDWESLEGRALSLGLKHAKTHGAKGLEEVLSSFLITERPFLEKNLSFLASTASNAPFIGLLGTVFGVMEAFQGLATSQGEASVVMLGISRALVATAFGLFVAIPAGVFYNTFQKQVKNIVQSLSGVKDICLAFVFSKESRHNG